MNGNRLPVNMRLNKSVQICAYWYCLLALLLLPHAGIPRLLFRLSQLEVQFKLLCCPGCVTSPRLENTLSYYEYS